jgi:hypothetical protein
MAVNFLMLGLEGEEEDVQNATGLKHGRNAAFSGFIRMVARA